MLIQSIKPEKPTFEYFSGDYVIGIGESSPRLSWKIVQANSGYQQGACEISITVVDTEGNQFKNIFRLATDQQNLVDWPAPPLNSREGAWVQVRVSDGHAWSVWSDAAYCEAGLLSSKDWHAEIIHSSMPQDIYKDGQVSLFRKSFRACHAVARARLYVTAQGMTEIEINGCKVGEDALLPGWTSYKNRLRYFTYDITHYLQQGANTVGAWLADGWFKGRLGFHGGHTNLFGDRTGLLVQLEIFYQDGMKDVICSDCSWRCTTSPVKFSGLYDGETFDATCYDTTWSTPVFDDQNWNPVSLSPSFNYHILCAPDGPAVSCTDEIHPVSVEKQSNGNYLVDFGQNMSARLRVVVSGYKGAVISFKHAEVLQDGSIYRRTLRLARNEDCYIIGNDNVKEEWEPRFTLHGFRYVEIEGCNNKCEIHNIVARVYHSDMVRTGWFECSHAGINKIFNNTLWSMRSNFVDIPTDCPQRDERLGWTGDIQVFSPSATFLYDVRGGLASWLKDLALEQKHYGNIPWYIPWIPGDTWNIADAGNVWGDVATITPWVLYENYDDIKILRQQYRSAKLWLKKITKDFLGENYLIENGMQLGDWLDPLAPPDNPVQAMTDTRLVATAYAIKSAKIMALIAERLGNQKDYIHYSEFSEKIKKAFSSYYIMDDGCFKNGTQTAYALAIMFDLYNNPEQIKRGGTELANLIRRNKGRIGTGFAGTPIILDALTRTGHLDEAYMLLLCEECPSWLYQVAMGATTIWERWDSMLADGSINPGEMTSFNHYALGAVIDWIRRVPGGLAKLDNGYKKILFHPQPGGGITSAFTRMVTPYGDTSIKWEITNNTFHVEVSVPPGSTGKLKLPDGSQHKFMNGKHQFTCFIES